MPKPITVEDIHDVWHDGVKFSVLSATGDHVAGDVISAEQLHSLVGGTVEGVERLIRLNVIVPRPEDSESEGGFYLTDNSEDDDDRTKVAAGTELTGDLDELKPKTDVGFDHAPIVNNPPSTERLKSAPVVTPTNATNDTDKTTQAVNTELPKTTTTTTVVKSAPVAEGEPTK